jgi:hypothetical protein
LASSPGRPSHLFQFGIGIAASTDVFSIATFVPVSRLFEKLEIVIFHYVDERLGRILCYIVKK